MGSVCCCMNADEIENFVNSNGSVHRNCACLGCFLQNFLNVYISLFRRGEMHAVSSSVQGAGSMTFTASYDNYMPDMYHSPSRPLPYDADLRYVHSQRDGLVSRRDKGSSHLQEESEPLRSDVDRVEESLSGGMDKLDSEGESKERIYKSPLKISSVKTTIGAENVYISSEDEDVCPTCLEDYTRENPKITTKCAHHFHLGCIYEWMERSDSCPVCGKAMAFDQAT